MPARWICFVLANAALASSAFSAEPERRFAKEYDLRELADLLPQGLDGIVEEITRDVMPETWQAASGAGTTKLVSAKAKLIVCQTEDVHDVIGDWIEQRIRLAEPAARQRRAAADLERLRRPPISTADLVQTDICEHLDTRVAKGRNLVFGIVTQLAWQELKSQIGSPVELAGDPLLARILNSADPAAARLDPACYAAVAGKAPEAVERLRRCMAQRFPGKTGPLLFPSDEHCVVLYAYFFRRLPFAHWFERQKRPLPFRTTTGVEQVVSFGIAEYSAGSSLHHLLREHVTILDYKSDDDFVIRMHADGYEDEMILAKVARGPTLGQTIGAVRSRIDERSAKTESKRLVEHESLLIPVIHLNLIDTSSEIRNTEILNSGWKGTCIGAKGSSVRVFLGRRPSGHYGSRRFRAIARTGPRRRPTTRSAARPLALPFQPSPCSNPRQ